MQTSLTLAERMSTGPLPVADALRVAAASAEQLRQMHEEGQVHGGLTPSHILICEAGVELLPADSAANRYTAPEVLAGRPADERSDIFSFGVIFYEMITGRRAWDGADEAHRRSGNPFLDQVVSGCVAKSPDDRFPQMKKVQFELRLLSAAARRGMPVADAPAEVPAGTATTANGDIQALEARISARMEQVLASFQNVANEVLAALRNGGVPGAAGRQPLRSFGGFNLDSESSLNRMDRAFELLNDKVARIDLAVGKAVERLIKLEQQLDEFDTDAAGLRDSVTRDVRNFERALKGQNAVIESTRTAMGQTDDLVERVVEALDSLQSMFMTSSEERLAAS